MGREVWGVGNASSVGAVVTDDHSVGLRGANRHGEQRPVVRPLDHEPTAGRGVEAHLEERSVLLADLCKKGPAPLVARRIGAIGRVVEVARRDVDAEAEAGGGACGRQILEDVPLPSAPRTRRYGVLARRARPKAESVVVLGGDHHAADPAVAQDLHPLGRIELTRVESDRAFRAEAFVAGGIGVDVEGDKGGAAELLPGELRRREDGLDGRRWRHVREEGEEEGAEGHAARIVRRWGDG